ncbi:hypothetical protein GGI20_003294 [Coemansia sp. BCRC 34301]|nr:hypothetical protein GGI20_003294 [Coemansia sp. BCRC 34301]
MSTAAIGLACAAVFFIAIFAVFYLRKLKGRSSDDENDSELGTARAKSSFNLFKFKSKKKKKQEQSASNHGNRGRDVGGQHQQRPRQQQQSSGGGQRARAPSSGHSEQQRSHHSSRYNGEEEEAEAPIPGLFDIPNYDDPEEPPRTMPRMPSPAAIREDGYSHNRSRDQHSTQQLATGSSGGGGGGGIIDQRFPDNPMPADGLSVMARMQDPRFEDSLPRPTLQTDVGNPYYGPYAPEGGNPYYGPYAPEGDNPYYGPYAPGEGPPPPPPPPPPMMDTSATHSPRPPNNARNAQYAGAGNFHPQTQPHHPNTAMVYDPRYMAVAAQHHQPMVTMQQQPQLIPRMAMQQQPQLIPRMAMQQQPQLIPMMPMMPAPVAQAPAPVAPAPAPAATEPQFRFEEEETRSCANRMSTSSLPAYSLH